MKPAEFVELSLNTPICAELKAYIDKLYLLFKNDHHKFITLCNETVTRGSSKTNIVYYLPFIFTTYQKEYDKCQESQSQ